MLKLRKIYTDGKSFTFTDSEKKKNGQDYTISYDSIMMLYDFIKSPKSKKARNFLICISVCHTTMTSSYMGVMNNKFISESEDELALLSSIKQLGFRFVKRDAESMHLKIFGEDMVFKVIALLPFDPIRKLMSIIVAAGDGTHLMFSKSADSSMLSRITAT